MPGFIKKEKEERRRLIFMFIGTLVLMVVLLFATYRNMDSYRRSVIKVQEYNATAQELERFFQMIRDQETGIRGYLLTQDSLFLKPYLSAKDELKEELLADGTFGPRASEIKGIVDLIRKASDLQVKWNEALERPTVVLDEGDEKNTWIYGTKADMDEIRMLHVTVMTDVNTKRNKAMFGEAEDFLDAPIMIALYSILTILSIILLFWRLNTALVAMGKVRANLKQNVMDLNSEVENRRMVQSMLQKVLDNSPSGIMSFKSMCNNEGKIIDFECLSSNKSADHFVGRSDVVGKSLLTLFPNTVSSGLFKAYVDVVANKTSFHEELHYEGEGINSWINIQAVKLEDGFMIVFNDITDRKRSEEMMAETDKLKLTAQLSRTVAHEIRNPLTNIHLAMEQLQDEIPEDNEDAPPFLEIIDRNLDRIGTLIKNMLESSKIRELDLVPCKMEDIVRDLMNHMQDRLQLKSMKGVVEVATELPTFMADCELIHLAINNITVNAVEAMDPEVGELSISAYRSNEDMILEIRDNGKGMEDHEIDRLFEPFYSSRPGGLGLGLATSRSILNSHGIQTTVKSSVGNGTSFYLRIPKAIFADTTFNLRSAQ
ncbi:MAG: CHASE3 domain-containing protein [Flavobacteriales bacterium]|nr:CHASE3 domain-containing protein [Flavobacteriales bacterium]